MIKVTAQGFTLIELMVVLALAVLIFSLVMQSRSLFHETFIRSEQDLLYATCLYLQQSAMATNGERTLTLHEDNGHGYTFDGTVRCLYPSIRFGVIPGVKGPPSAPTKELKRSITFKKQCITFYPDGIIDAGTLYLTDDQHTHLYALSSGVGVVSHLRRYRYEGGWQLRAES